MIRAAYYVSYGLLRRTLREGVVLRSLLFPSLLVVLTLLGTVLVVILMRPPPTLGVASDLPPALRATIEAKAAQFDVHLISVANAHDAVANGKVNLAIGASEIVMTEKSAPSPVAEAIARQALGGTWWPAPPNVRVKDTAPSNEINGYIVRIIAILFAFYGVVFGAGGVARDRSEGLLDSELGLPLPLWLLGLVRWATSTTLLGAVLAASVAMLHAVVTIPDPLTLTLHGIFASAAGTAIGLCVVGRHGLDRGFAGALSAGLVITASFIGLGLSRNVIAPLLPISSMFVSRAPLWPGLVALGLGFASAFVFSKRSIG